VMYFSAYTPSSGAELWKSDGTAAGTAMVQDIYPGSTGSNPNYLTASGSNLFFTATDPTHSSRLFFNVPTAQRAATSLMAVATPGTALPETVWGIGAALIPPPKK